MKSFVKFMQLLQVSIVLNKVAILAKTYLQENEFTLEKNHHQYYASLKEAKGKKSFKIRTRPRA